MVIESMHEKTDEAMCKLLQALFRSFVITIDQMKNVSSLSWSCMMEVNLYKLIVTKVSNNLAIQNHFSLCIGI